MSEYIYFLICIYHFCGSNIFGIKNANEPIQKYSESSLLIKLNGCNLLMRILNFMNRCIQGGQLELSKRQVLFGDALSVKEFITKTDGCLRERDYTNRESG